MFVRQWSAEVVTRQVSFTSRVSPHLALDAKVECPVCQLRHDRRQDKELEPWRLKQPDETIKWLVDIVCGYNSGYFCPNCGTSGLVAETNRDLFKQAVLARITQPWLQAAVDSLGCRVGEKQARGIPPADDYFTTASLEADQAGQQVILAPVSL